MTTNAPTPDAVRRLEVVLQEVLGASFEDEVRAQTENERWYRATLSVSELFRLWVRSRILDGDDPAWVFRGLRMADRRRLFQLVGLEASTISTSTPLEHAELVLHAVGLPVKRTRGNRSLLEDWHEVTELIETGEDERAATLGRQRAERFLRRMLYFYCATGHASAFTAIARAPGSLRVPRAFEGAGDEQVAALFVNDDIADLGFLALALRKLSSRVEEARILNLSGAPLLLLGQKEYEAFSSLGTALQPYTHDKPTKLATRRDNFAIAAQGVSDVVAAMASRDVAPDDVFVLETSVSLVGRAFRGVTDNGEHIYLMSEQTPPLGERVLYLSSASCKYATCIWTPNPWRF